MLLATGLATGDPDYVAAVPLYFAYACIKQGFTQEQYLDICKKAWARAQTWQKNRQVMPKKDLN